MVSSENERLISDQSAAQSSSCEEEIAYETVGDEKAHKDHKLGVLQLTLIGYFIVCAGPYGIEETVLAAGPFYTLIATAALPLLLSFPFSIVCCEMSSMFPSRGSTVIWARNISESVQKHCGHFSARAKFARFVSRLYTNSLLIKALVLNSILPTLICANLESLNPIFAEIWMKYIIAAVIYAGVVLLNIYGIDVVGWAQYAFAIIVLTPVVIFCFMSIPYFAQWKIEHENGPSSPDFALLFSNLVWQCTGFDMTTNLSEEVKNPQKTYPVSLLLIVFLLIISFFLPILCGVMIQPDYTKWVNGAFGEISLLLPGCENGWLQWWFIIGGVFSLISVLNNYVTCSSREIYQNVKGHMIPFCDGLGVL